jgi:hypothetical protein
LIAVLIAYAMIRIVPNPTFTCDVPLSVPGADKPASIKITYRHKGRKALGEYQARAVELAMQADAPDAAQQFAAYVGEVVEGWTGVLDADDKPLPYTVDNLARLLEAYPAAGAEIVRRYSHQLSHARAGN